jgi:hypothetical protein
MRGWKAGTGLLAYDLQAPVPVPHEGLEALESSARNRTGRVPVPHEGLEDPLVAPDINYVRAWSPTQDAVLPLRTTYQHGHSRLIGENISLVTHANYILSKLPSLDNDTAQWFFLFSDTIEKADRDLLGTPPSTGGVQPSKRVRLQQNAYREALKELGHDVTCPICKASPWHYTPGSCQACGNTPASME